MHYKKLIEAHRAFYRGEHRAGNYDRYMKQQKRWKDWGNPILRIDEIEKLFRFVRSWDRFFQGDPKTFQEIYNEIHPAIEKLKQEEVVDANLSGNELKEQLRDVFDKVANCTLVNRYESTDASKILHTILPNFFIMWDYEIRNWTVQGRRTGATYAFDFLPKMKEELEEAIATCMKEKHLSRAEAIGYIQEQTGGQTLAKLADEYNYTKYTLRCHSL